MESKEKKQNKNEKKKKFDAFPLHVSSDMSSNTIYPSEHTSCTNLKIYITYVLVLTFLRH
jgi:hypothetical protein